MEELFFEGGNGREEQGWAVRGASRVRGGGSRVGRDDRPRQYSQVARGVHLLGEEREVKLSSCMFGFLAR